MEQELLKNLMIFTIPTKKTNQLNLLLILSIISDQKKTETEKQ